METDRELQVIDYGKGRLIMRFEQEIVDEYVAGGLPCPRCRLPGVMTIDHIVPKMLLEQFGIDWRTVFIRDNLQILCKACNGFKGNRLDFAHPKTIWLLESLIKIIKTGQGITNKRPHRPVERIVETNV